VMSATLLAYHSDPKIKAKFVRRVEAHRKADELLQGATGEGGKGCAVWCTFDKYEHACGPTEIGYPEVLMHLEDAIFEGLPEAESLEWPTRFLKAAKPGADLSLVLPRFAVWNLTDAKWGAVALPNQPTDAIECCREVAALWQRVIDGETQDSLKAEFQKLEDRAWAGAWARAGARAWARARAWDYWRACADELERLIKEAK
jgi:hypothetical protein